MQVPEIIKPYINLLYAKEELSLAGWMGDDILSIEEINRIAGQDCAAILERAYKNASVNIVEGEQVKYKWNPVSMRVINMATFHREKWESLPKEASDIISQWHFDQFLVKKKAMDFEGVSAKKNKILPLDKAISYLRETAEEIYVIPCDCKSTAGVCDESKRQVCLEFSREPNSAIGRGYGKKLTLEEAEEVLRYADAQGLYHTAESDGICNCCRCCCYPGRVTLILGYKGRWPEVLYMANRDDTLCSNCGLCVQRCPKNAMQKGESGPVLAEENCWGCGLCVNTCPARAISLIDLK